MSEPSVTDWISSVTGIVGVLASTAIGFFTYRATRQVKAARTDIAELTATEHPLAEETVAPTVLAAASGGDDDHEFDARAAEASGGERWAVRAEPEAAWQPPGQPKQARPDYLLVNNGRPVYNVTITGVSSTDQASLRLPPMPVHTVDFRESVPIDVKLNIDSPPVIVIEIRWQNEDTSGGVARRMLNPKGR